MPIHLRILGSFHICICFCICVCVCTCICISICNCICDHTFAPLHGPAPSIHLGLFQPKRRRLIDLDMWPSQDITISNNWEIRSRKNKTVFSRNPTLNLPQKLNPDILMTKNYGKKTWQGCYESTKKIANFMAQIQYVLSSHLSLV